jgi:hypothetical protein
VSRVFEYRISHPATLGDGPLDQGASRPVNPIVLVNPFLNPAVMRRERFRRTPGKTPSHRPGCDRQAKGYDRKSEHCPQHDAQLPRLIRFTLRRSRTVGRHVERHVLTGRASGLSDYRLRSHWSRGGAWSAGPRTGHMPGRRNDRQGHSRSAELVIAPVIPCLVGQEMTPPIFQAGHEGVIPFARSNRSPQVKAGFLPRSLIVCPP